MTVARDPARSILSYVSTGSAGGRHWQAGMGGMAIGILAPGSAPKGLDGPGALRAPDQLAANFISLIACESMIAPPTRLVA